MPVMPAAGSAAIGLGIRDPVFRRRPGGGDRAAPPPVTSGGLAALRRQRWGHPSPPQASAIHGPKAKWWVASLPAREKLTPIPPRPLSPAGKGGAEGGGRSAESQGQRPAAARWLAAPVSVSSPYAFIRESQLSRIRKTAEIWAKSPFHAHFPLAFL